MELEGLMKRGRNRDWEAAKYLSKTNPSKYRIEYRYGFFKKDGSRKCYVMLRMYGPYGKYFRWVDVAELFTFDA